MAAKLALAEMVAHAARVSGLRSENAFLEAYKPVYKLEDRAWRIWRLHGPVEHRLVWV